MHQEETIAAIATPLGESGLAVVRLSGPTALAVGDALFVPRGRPAIPPSQAASHTIHYGVIRQSNRVIDEVLLAVMRAPRTFTKEDTVEITCHGGLLIARMVLDAVLNAGARLALPGEFTKRAFLNGRIDLAQAEAVADLIHARTELALNAAHEQLSGKLSHKINRLRDDLMHVLAHLEAHIDFPDEDIAPETQSELNRRLDDALRSTDFLLNTAREGQILRQGIRTAIVGRPNAGKSSLLNLLLGHDRAIVSPVPGTTRDTVEETANIRGIPIVFVDTAGLRESHDFIEKEGIRRSRESLERAELILHLLDQSQPLDAVDREYLAEFRHKTRLIVCNKIDLPPALELDPGLRENVVSTSCLTEEGIEGLKDAIQGVVWQGETGGERWETMINARHQEALRRGKEGIRRAWESLRDEALSLEIAAMELRIACNAIGEIVGKTTTEDLLDNIFSQFCLGK